MWVLHKHPSQPCFEQNAMHSTCTVQSLRSMEDGSGVGLALGEYNEDDEDDEEFVLSYQELFGTGAGAGPLDGQVGWTRL